jgi:hypothetical protein
MLLYRGMKKVFLIFIISLFTILVNAHPVHVSVCNLEIEDKNITIAIKLFSDDFQLALQHNYGVMIELDDLTSPDNKEILDKYINSALHLLLNKNEPLRLSYTKTDTNDQAIWLYYETEIEKLRKLKIKNTLLIDIYLDQTNLVIVNHKGRQNGYRFNANHTEQIIELK